MGICAVDETVYVYTPFYIPHPQSPPNSPPVACAICERNTESRMERMAIAGGHNPNVLLCANRPVIAFKVP